MDDGWVQIVVLEFVVVGEREREKGLQSQIPSPP